MANETIMWNITKNMPRQHPAMIRIDQGLPYTSGKKTCTVEWRSFFLRDELCQHIKFIKLSI